MLIVVYFKSLNLTKKPHKASKTSQFIKIQWKYLTVVHKAILDATNSWGRLRVNCDSVDSPNMLYPITATPAYIKVQIPKLQKHRKL